MATAYGVGDESRRGAHVGLFWCGLENLGNSCHLNAALQCMAANDDCRGSTVRSRSGLAGQNSTTTAAEGNSSGLVLELRSVLAVLAGGRFIEPAAAVMQPRTLSAQRAATRGEIQAIRRASSVRRALRPAALLNALSELFNSLV